MEGLSNIMKFSKVASDMAESQIVCVLDICVFYCLLAMCKPSRKSVALGILL